MIVLNEYIQSDIVKYISSNFKYLYIESDNANNFAMGKILTIGSASEKNWDKTQNVGLAPNII